MAKFPPDSLNIWPAAFRNGAPASRIKLNATTGGGKGRSHEHNCPESCRLGSVKYVKKCKVRLARPFWCHHLTVTVMGWVFFICKISKDNMNRYYQLAQAWTQVVARFPFFIQACHRGWFRLGASLQRRALDKAYKNRRGGCFSTYWVLTCIRHMNWDGRRQPGTKRIRPSEEGGRRCAGYLFLYIKQKVLSK